MGFNGARSAMTGKGMARQLNVHVGREWRWRESNPRPKPLRLNIYVRRPVCVQSLVQADQRTETVR